MLEKSTYTVNGELVEQLLATLEKGLKGSIISEVDTNAVKNMLGDYQSKLIDEAVVKEFEKILIVIDENLKDEINRKIDLLEKIAALQTPLGMLYQTIDFVADEKILKYEAGIENAKKDLIRCKYGQKSPLSHLLINEINKKLLQLFIECFSKNSTFAERLEIDGDNEQLVLIDRFLHYLSENKDSISDETMFEMKEAVENYIDIYKFSRVYNSEKNIAIFELMNKIFPLVPSDCSKSSAGSSDSESLVESSSTQNSPRTSSYSAMNEKLSGRLKSDSNSEISLKDFENSFESDEKMSGSDGVKFLIEDASAATRKSDGLYQKCSAVLEALSHFFQYIANTLMQGVKCVVEAPKVDSPRLAQYLQRAR